MRGTARRLAVLGVVVSIPLFGGCGGGPVPVAEVEGIVKMGGKPLSNVRVQFMPDPNKGTAGPISAAATDEQGHFKLTCADQRSGAVVGFHRVVITDMNVNLLRTPRHGRRDDDEKPVIVKKKDQPAPRKIAEKYTSVSSPLEVEVKRDKQEVEIDLTKGTVSHTS
jgi:hypothetical protein